MFLHGEWNPPEIRVDCEGRSNFRPHSACGTSIYQRRCEVLNFQQALLINVPLKFYFHLEIENEILYPHSSFVPVKSCSFHHKVVLTTAKLRILLSDFLDGSALTSGLVKHHSKFPRMDSSDAPLPCQPWSTQCIFWIGL